MPVGETLRDILLFTQRVLYDSLMNWVIPILLGLLIKIES